MSDKLKSERINGFDVIRTVAMWLGIILHSIIAYKTVSVEGWPFDHQFMRAYFDWAYDFIHIFRMPLFFLVAGFFTRLVILRSGMKYFIYQRYKRIFIPFILGTLIIVPITLLPFNYFRYKFLQELPFMEAVKNSLGKMFHWGGVAHLWFLYYLMLFYIVCVLCYIVFQTVLKKTKNQTQIHKKHISLILFCSVSISLLFLILVKFKAGIPPVYTGLKPKLFHLTYYGLFFGMGILINFQSRLIKSISGYWLFFLLLGIILNLILFNWEMRNHFAILIFLIAVETIFLVFGFIGFFVKFFSAESAIWRYLSDSAYWVYLIHMGIVAFFQVLLIDSLILPIFRAPIVLFCTLGLSLMSYHFLVRFTTIGEMLHGKRTKPH